MTTITELEWKLIDSLLGKILWYGGTTGKSMIVVHGEEDDRHAHCQVGISNSAVKI